MSKEHKTHYDGVEVSVPKTIALTTYKSRRNRGWTHAQAIGREARPAGEYWMRGFFLPNSALPKPVKT